MWAASQPHQELQNLDLQSLMAHMGISDAVRQRFLDPAVFSSKSGLITECMTSFSVFSHYIATLKTQHGLGFFV